MLNTEKNNLHNFILHALSDRSDVAPSETQIFLLKQNCTSFTCFSLRRKSVFDLHVCRGILLREIGNKTLQDHRDIHCLQKH